MIDRTPLLSGWQFRREEAPGEMSAWAEVDLPHTPFLPDLNGQEHWFGLCEYRRPLVGLSGVGARRHELFVGAAMHTATVFVDGIERGSHVGGYLPFTVDLSEPLRDGMPHELLLRLDNRENPDVPPGKPYREIDFCWYGGLYRGVELRTYPEVYITDPVSAGTVAGGGVFVRTRRADTDTADLDVEVQIASVSSAVSNMRVQVELWKDGKTLAQTEAGPVVVEPDGSVSIPLTLHVEKPALWSVDTPVMHRVFVSLLGPDGNVIDRDSVPVGIRTLSISRGGGFQINGRTLRLRGTNRHQEMPRVGYAMGRAAEYRDARRIKEAGFDYVRLSHYPQSPDFLDACDELGIVVMNAIPGWQFLGGPLFRGRCVQNARDLVRRDRNHPCVVLWELSLNETDMDEAFMKALQDAGHEEYPGDQMFTCGWKDAFDVFIHSRQHGKIHTWKKGDRALVIAEYGDWEFYAANHGFDQTTGAGVHADWSNSRQFRGNGERGLRQQVSNLVLALNDTMASPAVLDGQWAMFDYARGYHPLRAACGVMDVFRLPKFSYYLYRTQRNGTERGASWSGGYEVFVASHWVAGSLLNIPVFANVDEVELRLNGELVDRKPKEHTWMTQYLPHPPIMFAVEKYEPGILEAIGFVGGVECARHRVKTPGKPVEVKVEVDTMGIAPAPGESDVLFAHARICDTHGTLCVEADLNVVFEVCGQATLLGPCVVKAEAGIASVVVRIPRGAPVYEVRARFCPPEAALRLDTDLPLAAKQ